MTPCLLRYDFASDNTAGAAPEALSALEAANSGFSAAYGFDETTARAAKMIRAWLDADVSVYFVTSGTAANAISLTALCRPFEAVLAHHGAHIITAEAGAPNFFGHGLAITGLAGREGRIDPAALSAAVDVADTPYRQHPAALSLANATELGTLYSAHAMDELTSLAHAKGLVTHLDGARLVNAVAAGFNPRLIRHLGVDLLVIGGSKAGMLSSEAVVIFNPSLASRFGARLRQSGQLSSKSRFLAAPWIGMLEADRWVERAAHANAMARKLATLIPFEVVYPVETNAVFVRMDALTHSRLNELGWVVYRLFDGSVRIMCSWATSEEGVEQFAEVLTRLASEPSPVMYARPS
jgi:threonine aldolase